MGAVKRTHRAAREQEQYRKRTYRRMQAHPEEIHDLAYFLREGLSKILPQVVEAVKTLAKAMVTVTEAIAKMAADGTIAMICAAGGQEFLTDDAVDTITGIPEPAEISK